MIREIGILRFVCFEDFALRFGVVLLLSLEEVF